MSTITYITPSFAVAGEIGPADVAEIAALGFKSLLLVRPDGEEDGQPTARLMAATAWRNGLSFRHLPATKHDLFTDEVVDGMETALAGLPGPVLAHCKSGMRAVIAWAAATARSQSVDCVLDALVKAGFEFDFLRDDLDQQADRRHLVGIAAASDCGCDAGVATIVTPSPVTLKRAAA